jgi:hypothetical protein
MGTTGQVFEVIAQVDFGKICIGPWQGIVPKRLRVMDEVEVAETLSNSYELV